MAIKTIPKSLEYVCDRCDEKHIHENANGHHPDETRPPDWAQLRLARRRYDAQGVVLPDACVDKLLCPTCAEDIVLAVNRALMDI